MAKKNKPNKQIGTLILATIGGFALGYLTLTLIPNSVGDAAFYMIPIILLMVLLGYLIQIIIHEAGHLIFGLLTGYTFVSFRIGNLTLIKKDGQFRFANLNLPGTGGQCLMAPPAYDNGNFSFIPYNLGGVILNAITSILFLWLVNENWPMLVNVLLVGLAIGGLVAALTNGIPKKINGFPNDGYNIQRMRKNENAKKGFWLQLHTNDQLSKGVRPRDLKLDDFELESADELKEPLITSVQLLHYNYFLDQLDFVEAEHTLAQLYPYMEEIIPLYQNEIKLEQLFLEVIGENKSAVVHGLYTEDLTQYIEQTKNWLNRKRVLMAYEWFHLGNKEAALDYYQELTQLAAKHHNPGEAKMEVELGEWIKNQMPIDHLIE